MKGSLLIFLSATGYATVALFGKWIFATGLPLFLVLSFRFGIAAVLFFLLGRNRQSSLSIRQQLSCFLLGLVGDALQTTCFLLSVERVGASLASLLLYTFPVFVFLIERFFFHRPFRRQDVFFLLLPMLGCFLIVNPGKLALSQEYGVGLGLGLLTAILYACYLSFGAHFTKGLSPLMASSRITAGAALSFIVLSLSLEPCTLPQGVEWVGVLGMSIFATVIPLLSLIRGMQLIGAARTSLLFTLEPVMTILFATWLFQEPLTFTRVLGSLLILSTTFLVSQKAEVEKHSSGT